MPTLSHRKGAVSSYRCSTCIWPELKQKLVPKVSYRRFRGCFDSIIVTILEVNPRNLTLELGPAEIIENEEFSVDGLCQSFGAVPPSEYRYGKL